MKKIYESPEFEIEKFTIYCADDTSNPTGEGGWESGDNGEEVEF